MRKKNWMAVATVALAAAAPSVGMALVIDDFSEGAVVLTQELPGTSTGTQVGSGSGSILGNYRDAELNVTVHGITNQESEIEVIVGDGLLSYSNDPGQKSDMHMVWDGLNTDGLGGVDLTDAGLSNSIAASFMISDLGSLMTFKVSDTAGNESTLTQATGAGASNLYFGFEDFVPTVVGMPTDFELVDSVVMWIDAATNGDYIIQLIESANPNPEPATVLLGSMGLGGLATALRRRRTA